MTTKATTEGRPGRVLAEAIGRLARNNQWTLGLLGFLVVLLAFTKVVNPYYSLGSLASTATSTVHHAWCAR